MMLFDFNQVAGEYDHYYQTEQGKKIDAIEKQLVNRYLQELKKAENNLDISYYPLNDQFNQKIMKFLEHLTEYTSVKIETGQMSTLLLGEYQEVMQLINEQLAKSFAEENAVFNLKISNSCEWPVK